MKQEDIPTVEQLDPKLEAEALQDRSRLWRLAEGRLGWRGVIEMLPALYFIGTGLTQGFRSGSIDGSFQDPSGYPSMLFGFGILALVAWSNNLARLRAMLELLKRQERIRS